MTDQASGVRPDLDNVRIVETFLYALQDEDFDTVDRSLAKMGWHCSDTAELSFVDVEVPVANLVGEENAGFYYIAEQFVVERLALAVHAYGIAARSLELTAAYCRDRETFGRPLIANQVVRHKLVEMRRQVEVARAYAREVARRVLPPAAPRIGQVPADVRDPEVGVVEAPPQLVRRNDRHGARW